MEKKYWKSLEELNNQPTDDKADHIPHGRDLLDIMNEEIAGKTSSRRNFLKFCGFGFASAAILSSCENPVKKAIPYLNKPEEVTPGMANHYASTYFDGSEYSSILVKVRDGRPIKIEGNNLSPITKGRSSARVQASVLSLYDGKARLKGPSKGGEKSSWQAIDDEIKAKLKEISDAGQATVILTSDIISPSTLRIIDEFRAHYPGVRHVVYDPVSYSGMIKANKESYGRAVIPQYHFDKAAVVVSFMADFLGTWLNPSEFAAGYAATRDLTNGEKKLSYHIQYEAGVTISGSKADKRVRIKPSSVAGLLIGLYNNIAAHAGASTLPGGTTHDTFSNLAARLWENRGKSLVICGTNDPDEQIVVNAINNLLDNEGNTITFANPLLTRRAADADMESLVEDMNNGKAGGLILWNVNPAYDYHHPQAFTEGLAKLKLSVSLNTSQDETLEHVAFSAPTHHYLESWGDAEPRTGCYSLAQPAMRPIYNTRQAQESLMRWMDNGESYYNYLKDFWKNNIIKGGENEWRTTQQKGVFKAEVSETEPAWNSDSLTVAAYTLAESKEFQGYELHLYETIAMGSGRYANNPWLMELPDPVSRIVWDNYASVSPASAAELGLAEGSMLQINSIKVPVHIQPGQADRTISIGLGYGHTKFGKVADGIGVNVFPLVTVKKGCRTFTGTFEPDVAAGTYKLASTQMHHTMEGRPIVRETTLEGYLQKPDSGNELHAEFEAKKATLYKDTEYKGHRWAMAIDLNKCIGCSACVVSCQAENNVPVVGKEEVLKSRSMHWMRIDRYYNGDENNPELVFQPVMCQHCDNAPCENVCPVSATNHSSEGLNQMAYNRCVGTKYCINNCPYKVRRFNWFRYVTNEKFDYNMNSDLGRMVLNPDVTVRERGVVEKCSFCIQRIQEKKLLAKNENRPLADGEILPACAQACPSNAIVFGDVNDPNSEISKLFADPRNYHLLEELHTLPSVGYLTLVRNKPEA